MWGIKYASFVREVLCFDGYANQAIFYVRSVLLVCEVLCHTGGSFGLLNSEVPHHVEHDTQTAD